MKKFYMIALMAVASMTAYAQQNLTLSTYAGTNLTRYDGKECMVNVSRYVFNGWNTISLPFAMSEDELNEIFGANCKLEKLVGADETGSTLVLNFQDVKKGGIEANTPYLLYYTGENGTKQIKKLATIENAPSALSFTTNRGETVTMAGANTHVKGVGYYGILAVDNAEAQFVQVDETKSGFYATRCYVQLGSDNNRKITTNHLGAGEVSSIQMVANSSETVDVYNLSGVKVARNLRASEVNKLNPGIYVVKGQKITVK